MARASGRVGRQSPRMGAYWHSLAVIPGCGGDWVDVLDLGDGRLALCVGDAAGHDERAARFARRLREAMRRHLCAGVMPDIVVSRAMADVAAAGDLGEMFATAFLAVADARSGRVDYVNAGHPPVLYLPAHPAAGGGGGGEPCSLGPTGPILSDLFAGTEIWLTRSLTVAVGDCLLLYTDGISEARDEHGDQFGVLPLTAACAGTDSPDGLLHRLFTQVAEHACGAVRDDRTIAVLARQPRSIPPRGGCVRG
ncbi:PP2C family protein-serine/threonine phosphatase [Frankia sp. ACN1ag]|uniref:PP2C family protein-serine/threonine phosphatase n=1 Tax=Frankia sp. ACN1ag TaxID=102891 RepID=UPI001F185F84|nr:PP2C family protein-serine/threonine phosphatase [Frankia sp. ACN1ag]